MGNDWLDVHRSDLPFYSFWNSRTSETDLGGVRGRYRRKYHVAFLDGIPAGDAMTEYLVTEISGTHISNLEDAEQMAGELAEVAKTKYGVYVLLSEFYPTKNDQ